MKILLWLLVGTLLLTSCQTADHSTRQAQPRKTVSEVDTKPEKIAPTSL